MKSLSDYIFENEQKQAARSKATIEKIEEFYPIFNERYFDNELPKKINFRCRLRSNETWLACQGFEYSFYVSPEYMVGDMYQMYYRANGQRAVRRGKGWKWIPMVDEAAKVTDITSLEPYIEFNLRYEFSDHEFEDTLIHEMIHLWVSKDGLEPKRAHGKEFMKKCTEIRKLAKKKYNVDYVLGNKASADADYGLTKDAAEKIDKELKSSIEKAVKSGVLSVYIAETFGPVSADNTKITHEEVMFCTKNVLRKLWWNITGNKNDIYTIKLSPTGYQEMCEKLHYKIPKQTSYKYFNFDQFVKPIGSRKEVLDILNKNAFSPSEIGLKCKMFTDKAVTEGREDKEDKNKNKDEMEGMLCINAPVGDVNIEDVLNRAEELLDKENEGEGKPIKGLKLIDGKKK